VTAWRCERKSLTASFKCVVFGLLLPLSFCLGCAFAWRLGVESPLYFIACYFLVRVWVSRRVIAKIGVFGFFFTEKFRADFCRKRHKYGKNLG